MLTDTRLNAIEADGFGDFAQRVEYIADTTGAPADVVEILAVSPCLIEP